MNRSMTQLQHACRRFATLIALSFVSGFAMPAREARAQAQALGSFIAHASTGQAQAFLRVEPGEDAGTVEVKHSEGQDIYFFVKPCQELKIRAAKPAWIILSLRVADNVEDDKPLPPHFTVTITDGNSLAQSVNKFLIRDEDLEPKRRTPVKSTTLGAGKWTVMPKRRIAFDTLSADRTYFITADCLVEGLAVSARPTGEKDPPSDVPRAAPFAMEASPLVPMPPPPPPSSYSEQDYYVNDLLAFGHDIRVVPFALAMVVNGSFKPQLEVKQIGPSRFGQEIRGGYGLMAATGPGVGVVLDYNHMLEGTLLSSGSPYFEVLSIRYMYRLPDGDDKNYATRFWTLLGAEVNQMFMLPDVLRQSRDRREFTFDPLVEQWGFGLVLGKELHRPNYTPIGIGARIVPYWNFAKGDNNVPVKNPGVRLEIVFHFSVAGMVEMCSCKCADGAGSKCAEGGKEGR